MTLKKLLKLLNFENIPDETGTCYKIVVKDYTYHYEFKIYYHSRQYYLIKNKYTIIDLGKNTNEDYIIKLLKKEFASELFEIELSKKKLFSKKYYKFREFISKHKEFNSI